jgi:transcriptional antiterminator RfaH
MSRWYVVHTHPHAEQAAVENLRRQGFRTYLPRCRKRRRHARRTDMVVRPFFPRYLFVCLDLCHQRWRAIMSTVGVSDLVRFGEMPAAVPDGVVESLIARECDGLPAEPSVAETARPGDPVRLADGPFADLVARFQEMADAERVFVLLDLLGRKVRVKVRADTLAAIG